MLKCAFRDCANKVIGGFHNTIDAGNFQDPTATLPGMRVLWCKEHESSLNQGLGAGRYFTPLEMKQ